MEPLLRMDSMGIGDVPVLDAILRFKSARCREIADAPLLRALNHY
jgi:hypothetical protein